MTAYADPDDEPEPAGTTRHDTRERILDNGRVLRRDTQPIGGLDKCCGGRLPRQAQDVRVPAVQLDLEQTRKTGSRQHLLGVSAGRDQSCPATAYAQRTQERTRPR